MFWSKKSSHVKFDVDENVIDKEAVINYIDKIINEFDYRKRTKAYMIEQLERVKRFVQNN